MGRVVIYMRAFVIVTLLNSSSAVPAQAQDGAEAAAKLSARSNAATICIPKSGDR